MAATVLDTVQLSNYIGLSPNVLQASIETPTPALVQQLLQTIAVKFQEHERVQAANSRLEIELESAVRSGESKARAARSVNEKSAKDVEELRRQLQASQQENLTLQNQLSSRSAHSETSSTEVAKLQKKLDALEASHADTLNLLSSRNKAYDGIVQELTVKHEKTVELRQEIQELEKAVRTARADTSSFRIKETSQQQEIESLKRSNEWLDSELKAKTAEHTKFRKDKNARVAELQRSVDDNLSTIEALQKSEESLRTRVDAGDERVEKLLGQIQSSQEDSARQLESLQNELQSTQRLSDLLKSSADSERQRQRDVSEQLERTRSDASREIGRISAELESEHQALSEAEARINELEVQVERLEHDATQAQMPSTPRLNASARILSTPSRGMSPTPGSARRLPLSMTQIVNDYHVVKSELEIEKQRNEKLSATIDEMIQDMERRQPEILELQAEREQQESNLAEISELVDSLREDQQQSVKAARKWESEVIALTNEGDLLRQQLRDLSSQVKVLLLEVSSLSDGSKPFSQDERSRLQRLITDEATDLENLSDTDRYISEQLTTFKNVIELVDQNNKLLRISRELGAKMENEDTQAQQTKAAEAQEELETLQTKYERLKDEMHSLTTQSNSFIQERDMFRRMLMHKGRLPAGADPTAFFDQSVIETPRKQSMRNSEGVDSPTQNGEAFDYAKMLKKMQTNFDEYRREAAQDRSGLKDEIDVTKRQNSELHTQLTSKNSEVLLVTERYEMLQGNYRMIKNENSELQKRSQTLAERAGAQELRTQQTVEDLLESRSLLESTRKEIAVLQTEKTFWKTIETRLTEDNHSLMTARDQLNSLNVNLQNLLNEREHSDQEARRRSQTQIENLEAETHSMKRKLNDLTDENRRNAQRHEYESKQAQTRIDDLLSSLNQAKEQSTAVSAARDALQTTVNELTIELRSAEERLTVLQASVSGRADSDANEVRDLALHESELRRDLDLAKNELKNAQAQIEQYKTIAQTAEDQLSSVTEAQETYVAEMDSTIAEQQRTIDEKQQEIEDLKSSHSAENSELETLRIENADSTHKLDEQRRTFEAEIATMKENVTRLEQAVEFTKQDITMQAGIARSAQQNYEVELQKHAEAAKALQNMRANQSNLKFQIAEAKAAMTAAQEDLSVQERSWAETKEKYENELRELRSRGDDVRAQNRLLHNQLENVSSQIASLQARRDAGSIGDATMSFELSSSTGDLQEIVNYLRREKEIVEVQHNVSASELKRVRHQLEFTQTQLDETRMKLTQLRHSQDVAERQALDHRKLMDTVNEMNLLRESNVTLRLEKTQAEASVREKLEVIEKLQEEISPLHAKVQELEDTNEQSTAELRMVTEAKNRFEQRYLDVLHKSNAIDPAEVENLNSKVTELTKERDELVSKRDEITAQRDELQTKVDGFPAELEQQLSTLREQHAESRNKLIEQSKAKNRQQTGIIKEREATIAELTTEKESLDARLKEVQSELEATATARTELQTRLTAVEEKLNGQAKTAEPTADTGASDALQRELDAARAAKEQESTRVQQLQSELETARAEITKLKEQLSQLESSLQMAREQVQSQADSQANIGANDAKAAELQKTLDEAQAEIVSLKQTIDLHSRAAGGTGGEGDSSASATLLAEIEALKAEQQQKYEEKIKQADDTLKARSDQMRSALTKRLQEGKEQITKDLTEKHELALSETQRKHQEELEALTIRLTQEASTKKEEPSTTEGSNSRELPDPTTLSDTYIKELVAKNEWAKKFIASNVKTRVEQAKEAAEKVAEKAVEKATKEAIEKARMEVMKTKVQVQRAEKDHKMAQAKVDYVSKAAEETPEKPVGEVWAVAKDVKPVVAPAAKPTAQSQPATQTPAEGSEGLQASQFSPQAKPAQSVNGSTTGPGEATQTRVPPATGIRRPSISAPSGIGRGSGIPVPQSSSGTPSIAGRGSSIPRGRGGFAGRGSSIPRGGASVASTTNANAGLNAGAKQFVPQKRGREDSVGGQAASSDAKEESAGLGSLSGSQFAPEQAGKRVKGNFSG